MVAVSKIDARTVLVVEDEWLIAELLQEALAEAGYRVIGPASRVREGLELLENNKPDIAVLDVSLRGETSFAVARALAERSIPFVFMTGYVSNDLLGEFKERPVLNKPVDDAKLLSCIAAALDAPEIA
jgi:CheY-like chemotaxis protein